MYTVNFRLDNETRYKLDKLTEKLDPSLKNKSHVIREVIHDRYWHEFHEILDEEKRTLFEILDDPNNADLGIEMVKKLLKKNGLKAVKE